jgi:superfamily II DNA or RNA helicase
MTTMDARASVEFDETEGFGIVAFRDQRGQLLDGSGGVDSLLEGFAYEGRQVRIPARYTQLLNLIAEHGGRWRPERGFLIREAAIPDLVRAMRVLPEASAASEERSLASLTFDAKPLRVTEDVELVDDDTLRRTARFESPAGEAVSTERVTAQADTQSWLRFGRAFYQRPDLSREELATIRENPASELHGDAIPYFFAKQLAQLQRERGIVLGPRAAGARVSDAAWMADVAVTLSDAGRLRLGVGFLVGDCRLPRQQAASQPEAAYLRVGRDRWVQNDPHVLQQTDAALGAVPNLEALPGGNEYEAPAQALPLVQELLARVGTVRLDESAEALRRKLEDFHGIEDALIPQGMRAELRPYQKAGYNWLSFLRTYGLSGVLADDMGLGKTVQTLTVLLASLESGETEPSLVVCPASVMSVWKREVERWCTGLTPVVLSGRQRAAFFRHPRQRRLAIASYNTVAREAPTFQHVAWNYLILDEAHHIKNPATAQARACKSLLARHRLALTGTPVQNRLAELWSIFDFLMQGYLGTAPAFEREFEVPITHAHDAVAVARLKHRIDPFKLRRTKTEVAQDLPPLTQQVMPVKLLDEQRRLYDAVLRSEAPELIERLKQDPQATMMVFERILRLRQIAAHPRLLNPGLPLLGASGKFEAFVEVLEDALEEGHKVLVFSQWAQMAGLIRQHLTETGVRHLYLDGSVPVSRRPGMIEAFQRPDGPEVMVLSLLAAGEGLTLTEADVVLLYDRWWNPAVEEQAIARTHRIGQTKPVTAYILQAEDTIEERLADLLARKRDLASTVIEVDQAEKSITRDDLVQLLQDELAGANRARREEGD